MDLDDRLERLERWGSDPDSAAARAGSQSLLIEAVRMNRSDIVMRLIDVGCDPYRVVAEDGVDVRVVDYVFTKMNLDPKNWLLMASAFGESAEYFTAQMWVMRTRLLLMAS